MGNLTGLFGSVLAVYGLMLGGMFVFQRSLLYLPPGDRPVLASVAGTGIEAVTVTTKDGLDLVHWYRPPAVSGGPVIVVFHCNAGHIGDWVPKYWPLLKAGFGLFLAEYRGYGGNPGSPSEAGLTADGLSVLAHLGAQGVAPERIVLYGESLGTGVAIKLAAEHPVAGLVLEAPPGSIAELAQAHYWYVPAKWLLLDPWNAIDLMHRVTAPLLLLHGEADRVVPVRFGRNVYEAAEGEKEALFLPTGGHADLFTFPEVRGRVIDFVRRKVPAAKGIEPASG
jgi:fermentation-respiration switch protein FrsA (DUF1100 family)